jgi:Bacterial regulatory proteins, lacI family
LVVRLVIVLSQGKHFDNLKSGKRPTLEDVARVAKVALMTVSRVITNHRYVSRENAEEFAPPFFN